MNPPEFLPEMLTESDNNKLKCILLTKEGEKCTTLSATEMMSQTSDDTIFIGNLDLDIV